MPGRDVIVVGASAGGVEALIELVGGLPRDLAAALFVVLHLPITARSSLPTILSRSGPLSAVHATDGALIEKGRIYVAPPNRHLALENGQVRLVLGPRENNVRPAADHLFRSAARAYGPRVVGVLLSGNDSDGTLGLDAIGMRGGIAIVQDPREAAFPGMPSSALQRVKVHHSLPVEEIAPLLVALSHQEPEAKGDHATMPSSDPDAGGQDNSLTPRADEKQPGQASGLTCPDCHGSIWMLEEGSLIGLECRVGHRYSPEAFLEAQSARVEDALWTATNVLQERAQGLRQLATRVSLSGRLAASFDERARDLEQQAALIRQVIVQSLGSDGGEQGGQA